MAKLSVYLGAMNSGKSAHLLMNVHNYESNGKKIVIVKPKSATREDAGFVKTRIGLQHECIEVNSEDNVIDTVFKELSFGQSINIDCIFVDEAHFLTREQIVQLTILIDEYEIPVVAYGLKNSYVASCIFEGTQELLYQANNVYEIKSTCELCNSKATHHIREVDGQVIRTGESLIVGDVGEAKSERYMSVCRKCYYDYEGSGNNDK